MYRMPEIRRFFFSQAFLTYTAFTFDYIFFIRYLQRKFTNPFSGGCRSLPFTSTLVSPDVSVNDKSNELLFTGWGSMSSGCRVSQRCVECIGQNNSGVRYTSYERKTRHPEGMLPYPMKSNFGNDQTVPAFQCIIVFHRIICYIYLNHILYVFHSISALDID